MSGSSFLFQGLGLGAVNPAFTADRDLYSLSLDRASSSLEDDPDATWERNYDSGLFDDEDMDSVNEPAYSYSRQQMIFTDTHL
ncbi:hypothetical protein C0Q70_07791 [Pomacea canaliculata]|uniref:Uncharacterized protein n=1 Tax=Pomacea canaliculata TaxID=400727 RepID=A0A2T7PG10_POMCA|nr:hypothetical protein C0Q70_07791 [Pomacea canaliculata]